MDLAELVDHVKTKEDFVAFLSALQNDLARNNAEWENPNLEQYLEAMEAYLRSSTENSLHKVDFTPTWSLFASIMLTASIYE